MHHALFLPEITRNIFELLNPFISEPKCAHRPNPLRLEDLVAVATTCHALSGPALDALWHTQVCFGPLLMCMPPSVVEVQDSDYEPDEDRSILSCDEPYLRRSIHLIQDPSPSDLLWMLPYARRIKNIGPPVADCHWPLPELFSIPSHIINWLFSAYPMQRFLPRLTYMSCLKFAPLMGMGDIMDVSFAPLSRSNLKSFDLYSEFDEEVGDWPLLSALVNDLPQLRTIRLELSVWDHNMHKLYSSLCLFRNLEHLDLTISRQFSEDYGIADIQIKFPCLQKLKLSSPTKFAASFLTALQSTVLHTLDLMIMELYSSAGSRHENLDRHRVFSSLRCLTISSDFCFMMSLIEAVDSSALNSISLFLPPTFDGEHIARAFTALIMSKRGWASSLRTITLHQRKLSLPLSIDNDVFCGSSHPYFLAIEDLLVFSHLQHVILDDLVISLDASVCKKLATGWPDLVEFDFNPSSIKELATATINVGSLATFARHCPNLSRLQLGIPLDTTELPVLDDETLTILSSRPTRSTCMLIAVDADSYPANPKAVAKFLATVFPGREIKIVITPSYKPSDGWNEVVEWLRRSQPSSLGFGSHYYSNLCSVCRFGQ
ncbi:uncharacterized protein EDB91DRAFT_1222866 [Suillus paluster]|uniref:uncharacterized protein n=1 Tax=Suillus paluster TaxID=48578 RepID=UPI001B8649D8|nr:uncharacterized protein EDB91DRAFT_1222866 [Suillus paluster]KAG1740505.1 hypothetical protein EDB91DRAFT_1222866 [Suillus paluster]